MYPNRYIISMYTIKKTEEFIDWLLKLKDRKAKAQIAIRISRVQDGLFGNQRSLGKGLSEIKIDFGPGYRIYYTIENDKIVFLLIGGDKSSQERDIIKARIMLKNLKGKIDYENNNI
jgi:putative addiction module killer protein